MVIYHPFRGQKPVKQRIGEVLRNVRSLLDFDPAQFYLFGNPNKDPMRVLQNYVDVVEGRATIPLLRLNEKTDEIKHRWEWQVCMAIELVDNPFANRRWEQRVYDIIRLLEKITTCTDPLLNGTAIVEASGKKLAELKKVRVESTTN